jgi:hypothetical protein
MSNKISDEELINYVSSFEAGITPKSASFKLGFKHSYIKNRFYRLGQKGLLIYNYLGSKGYYGVNSEHQKTGHGLAFRTEPRIQNFILFYENCDVSEVYNIKHGYPIKDPCYFVREKISKQGNLTIHFSGEYGFDISSVVILSEHFISYLCKKYDVTLDLKKVMISNIEIFNDFYKIGLSPTSFTLYDLQGSIKKIYSNVSKIRCEDRFTPKISLDTFFQEMSNPINIKYHNQITNLSDRIHSIEQLMKSFISTQQHFNKKIIEKTEDKNKEKIQNLEFIPANHINNYQQNNK